MTTQPHQPNNDFKQDNLELQQLVTKLQQGLDQENVEHSKLFSIQAHPLYTNSKTLLEDKEFALKAENADKPMAKLSFFDEREAHKFYGEINEKAFHYYKYKAYSEYGLRGIICIYLGSANNSSIIISSRASDPHFSKGYGENFALYFLDNQYIWKRVTSDFGPFVQGVQPPKSIAITSLDDFVEQIVKTDGKGNVGHHNFNCKIEDFQLDATYLNVWINELIDKIKDKN